MLKRISLNTTSIWDLRKRLSFVSSSWKSDSDRSNTSSTGDVPLLHSATHRYLI